MAPIKEFSSADLNTISRLSGVSNVLVKVNGATVAASSFSGLLDTYTGAAAAYSTRRLNSQYTGAAMRVREDSGDTETDIGFDANGDLDTSAIATHCGSANGYVVTWYDQSGNTNNATQSTGGSQPQIYNGSAVITTNGKPAVLSSSTRVFSLLTLSSAVNQNDMGMYAAGQWLSGGPNYAAIMNLLTSQDDGMGLAYRGDQFLYNDTGVNTHAPNNYDQHLWSGYADNATSDVKGFIDGSQIASTTPVSQTHSTVAITGLGYISASTNWNGYSQELIIFSSSTKANNSGIEGNINAYFQIGNFGTPTSGLLSTYTGAAAAYSVRQLANTAALSMRVRRDNDDAEQDFGFDANGDLDTSAIATFVGSGNNGYVSKWYDQSGNQNDAEQSTNGSQPQIYDGSAVITENGKPALQTTGGDKLITASLSATSFATQSGFVCAKSNNTGYASIMEIANSQNTGGRAVWIGVNNSATEKFGSAAYGGQLVFGGDATSQFLGSFIGVDGGSSTTFVDGAQVATATTSTYFASTQGLGLAGPPNSTYYPFTGVLQECILYASDQSSNRSGIETDINNYFSIY